MKRMTKTQSPPRTKPMWVWGELLDFTNFVLNQVYSEACTSAHYQKDPDEQTQGWFFFKWQV